MPEKTLKDKKEDKKAKETADAKKAKEEAPAKAALVGGMPDATFYDKAKCKHTYTSPRKVEDFGLD